jgi:radical SAM enzyme (TIGR01210 family)
MTFGPVHRQRILQARRAKGFVSPDRAHAFWNEQECWQRLLSPTDTQLLSTLVDVTTMILVGAECRFACTMCDLWQHTLDHATPRGAIPRQIDVALQASPPANWVKLYNASNFFDPYAVPLEDLPTIAKQVARFDRVIVENHPRMTRASIEEFARAIPGQLEIAMGLETVEPVSLELLNKESTLEQYIVACDQLRAWGVDIRAFVLLQPPGVEPSESVDWALQAIEFAQKHGARHVSLIPTRAGYALLSQWQRDGLFRPPLAGQLEQAIVRAIQMTQEARLPCTVTADLWNWDETEGCCTVCRAGRRSRLEAINLSQQVEPMPTFTCRCTG